jgi:signal transduction histidine kinase
VCNHEMLANSPSTRGSDTLQLDPSTRSIPRSKGRRFDDDRSGVRLGGPDRHLARLPSEPALPQSTRREIQQAMRREDCANAVANDRERIAEGLYDSVIHRLFAAGLQLQATCQVVDAPAQARIETTIDLLDATIAELRKAIFSLH